MRGEARTRANGPRGPLRRLTRLIRYRLVVPMLRSRHDEVFTARGVAMGVFWGLTPTVGFQTPLVLGAWAALRALGWPSSLVQTIAWTWIDNPVTILPIYYLCHVTGQILLGRWDDLAGYGAFQVIWAAAFDDGLSAVERARTAVQVLGWPTLVGCLPWAAGGGVLSYRWSLRFLRRRAARRRGARPGVVS